MNILIESLTEIPDRNEMDGMLQEYFDVMVDRLTSIGGPSPDTSLVINEFWREAHHYLPPTGQTLLARDPDGNLIGMGSLRAIEDGKGELKRLYVRPTARGTGLGRRLVERRIQTAREMGLKTLLADTFKANVEMLGLYESLGFERIEGFVESATFNLHPEFHEFMAYVRLSL
ncbi:GNAT family N-acetyltransferase [Sulfitobacter mediterraneus]|uniref:Acetyltransferase (GNAT) family protein n=1 Tax=Sulfitobacter mediterraneus TaxID=83219 RepID=A0A2T6BXC7_9RHOB|nr:GNAT family N-acetyltransferase [Sulfitobacter mediterraneus]PTX60686.1 acetyltransferase (GNAT) family protein [Sulfitobacter mediterraneus]